MVNDTRQDDSLLIWQDLQLTVRNRNCCRTKSSECCARIMGSSEEESLPLLKGVSGYTTSGKLTAIMGPSGAGKTTLLGALARRIELTGGSVILDGHVLSRDAMYQISGFVPQVEAMPGSLTTAEYTFFACTLKRFNCTRGEREDLVEKHLRDLGLYDSRDSLISTLSGGEAKRLSLAVELITDPRILFLDEPTSGLDRFSAMRVIESLKTICLRGAIVLCTIHQPGMMLYELFDKVAWIADGRSIFCGDLKHATRFFASQGYSCPEDFDEPEFYIKVASLHNNCEGMSQAFLNSAYSQIPKETIFTRNYIDPPCERRAPCIVQVFWLLWRLHLQRRREFLRDWITWLSYVLSVMAVGVFYGGIDTHNQEGVQNARGAIYMTNSEIFFTVAYSVIHELPGDLCTYVREAALYSPGPYYIATLLNLAPKVILKAFLFTFVLYLVLIDAEHSLSSFFYYCLCTTVAAICGTSYGIMFSSWILDIEIATTVMIPIDTAFLLTAGVFYNLRALPKYLMYFKYGSIFFYANEAISVLYWPRITTIECYENPELPCLSSGEEVLSEFGFNQSNFWWDLLGMLALTVVMCFVGYLGVKRRRKTMEIF